MFLYLYILYILLYIIDPKGVLYIILYIYYIYKYSLYGNEYFRIVPYISHSIIYDTPMTIQLDGYTLPEHISYSAFTTYIDCGYQYYLGRLLNLPEQPSVWSVGGSSFHTATEMWDLENL